MSECKHVLYFDKDTNYYKCKKPKCKFGVGLFVAADRLNEHASLTEKVEEYKELLQAMKLRDGRLDPVWMEQYATERLALLESE